MERGVIAGGILISASFLLAVLLNRSADGPAAASGSMSGQIGKLNASEVAADAAGTRASSCWVNHLSDLRQVDPQQGNFGQAPFDIGQCRRDCPNFRAIEDRLQNIMDFLSSAGTNADLQAARENQLRNRIKARAMTTRASSPTSTANLAQAR